MLDSRHVATAENIQLPVLFIENISYGAGEFIFLTALREFTTQRFSI